MDLLPIGGSWRHGRAGTRCADHNPYTGETLIEIPEASRADLDEAYLAAARAQPAWAARLPAERANILRQAANLLERRHEEVISWLIRESGSTRLKATMEWTSVQTMILEACNLPYYIDGRISPSDTPGREWRIYRKPVGVVGVISPWNWPLQLTARSLFPALATGNAVVVKPAAETPVTGGLLLARILEEAGLPPGLMSVIVGAGAEIGDAFVTHPVPRVISFTGSASVGRRIAHLVAAAGTIKRAELELGGDSPFVVLADADLENAVRSAVFGKFLHQGQFCMVTNRFIVEAAVYSEFERQFVNATVKLKLGDPNEPDTLIGPLVNRRHLEGLLKKLAAARAAGLRELCGGEPDGLVLPPHVFGDVPSDHPLVREELFGPVAPLIRARDEADALRRANETAAGLSGTVFTGDFGRGLHFARQMGVGLAHVNDWPMNDLPFNPSGGEKNSGVGRFNGRWVVDAFTTQQWVAIQRQPRFYAVDAREIAVPWAPEDDAPPDATFAP